jgi:hypothetical protein
MVAVVAAMIAINMMAAPREAPRLEAKCRVRHRTPAAMHILSKRHRNVPGYAGLYCDFPFASQNSESGRLGLGVTAKES